MDWRRNLLWIDGSGGVAVGVLVLTLAPWLAEWHRLPHDFLLLMGAANLGYGAYSLTLARQARRPMALIGLLVLANLTWAVLCLRWAAIYWDTASPLGLLHLIGEGVFVGGLAILEWRWRELLRTRPTGVSLAL